LATCVLSRKYHLKFLHRKRGKAAIEAIDIIPRYGGKIIHDCWASYLSYLHCGHGLCGSHLLRELTFIFEANGYAWARNMKRLLQETCIKVSNSEEKKLADKDLVNLQEALPSYFNARCKRTTGDTAQAERKTR